VIEVTETTPACVEQQREAAGTEWCDLIVQKDGRRLRNKNPLFVS